MKNTILLLALVLGSAGLTWGASPAKPNIVIIYADDIGYGDPGCYGATRVKTPNLDRLAREGLRFTDAHSAAATCTPSRYALLTGEYAFRKPGAQILKGDAALLIAPGRPTIASLLQQAGYTTGVVGKWHLGLGTEQAELDWNHEIKPGPREIGFNYSFIIPATGDRTPCVFVENQRVVGADSAEPIRVSYGAPVGDDPTGKDHPELLTLKPSHGHNQTIVNGISRIGYMSGGQAARWVDADIADVITRQAVSFIEKNQRQPFFLYFATHDIHVPRVPHPRFAGQTAMGPRGDVIVELDWSAGEILQTLERLKLATNTLVIFSSDNGPVLDDGYQDQARELVVGHQPSGPFRGGKNSNFEGGTRVPLLVRWPGRVAPGTSAALISQVDLLASFAALTGQKLAATVAPDSFNLLPALLGETKAGRETLVEQAGSLSLRHGDWKYIAPGGGRKMNEQTKTETGNDAQAQIYHLANDAGERNNLAAQPSGQTNNLADLLEKIKTTGRSRP